MDVLHQTCMLMYVGLSVAAKLKALLFPSITDQTGNSNLYLQRMSIIHWVDVCLFGGRRTAGWTKPLHSVTHMFMHIHKVPVHSITHPCSPAATIVTDNK